MDSIGGVLLSPKMQFPEADRVLQCDSNGMLSLVSTEGLFGLKTKLANHRTILGTLRVKIH